MKSSNLQKTLAKSEQYLPAEDTFFLADHLEGLSGDSALDIGGESTTTQMSEKITELAKANLRK